MFKKVKIAIDEESLSWVDKKREEFSREEFLSYMIGSFVKSLQKKEVIGQITHPYY